MVGVIEGVAEATALIVKVSSGTLSDYLGRRKVLAVVGYSLGGLSKPSFASRRRGLTLDCGPGFRIATVPTKEGVR